MTIEGKVVLVTGAASGIGLAAAQLLVREGAHVVIADRDDNLENVAKAIADDAGTVSHMAVELGESSSVGALVGRVEQDHGRIDILVHAGGICRPVPLLEMSDDQWREMLRINLDGTFFLTRDVGRLMAAQRSGTMILLTSDRGVQGAADYAHYAASKGGMIALTKSLALALGKYNVTVNGLNPGMTDTPLARGANPESWDKKVALDMLGKASMPQEIAQTILFLASTAGAYTTGQIFGTRLRHGQ